MNAHFPRKSRSPHRRLGTSRKFLGQLGKTVLLGVLEFISCLNALETVMPKIVSIVRFLAHYIRLFWNQKSVQWTDERVPETKEYFHSRRKQEEK